jgi:hypothetical protein
LLNKVRLSTVFDFPANPAPSSTSPNQRLGLTLADRRSDCRNRQKSDCLKKFEEFLNVAVLSLLVEEFELRRSPVGLPRSLDVAADLAELPESLMRRFEQQGSRGGMGHQIGV